MTPPITVIRADRSGWAAEFSELWRYRELLGFLAWRDVRVRYAQTFIGVAWALIEPLVAVVVFTLIFNRVAGLSSGSIPYPLFCFAGMLLWGFFARCLRDMTVSFVTNASLVRKIYFPRLVLPFSTFGANGIDFVCGFLMYLLLAAYYGCLPTVAILTLPVWLALAGLTVMGVGLALSAVNIRFRDVTRALPFVVQTWMFASPVAYPLDTVPDAWQFLYRLNPMVAVVEGARWALLPGQDLDPALILPGLVVSLLLAVLGLVVFSRSHRGLADVI